MTTREILPSAFIIVYLAAVVASAIPSPVLLERVTGERDSPDDRVARVVRPWLDAVQPAMEVSLSTLWSVTAAIRTCTGWPLRKLGIGQRWRMFAQPPRMNSTLAIRLVATDASGRTIVRSQQLLPLTGDEGYKSMTAFRINAAEKAVANANAGWSSLRRGDDALGESTYGQDVLKTVARVFGQRLAPTLGDGSRITRVELWYGVAPMPIRGELPESRKPELDGLPVNARLGAQFRTGRASWTLREVDTLIPQ